MLKDVLDAVRMEEGYAEEFASAKVQKQGTESKVKPAIVSKINHLRPEVKGSK